MVIRNKLHREKQPIDLQKAINAGAAVKEDEKDNDAKYSNFCVRMPVEMRDRIEKLTEGMIGITMTGWILQTLDKELKRNEIENK